MISPQMANVAEHLKAMARTGSFPYFDGSDSPQARAYIERCRRVHLGSGAIVLFTRDVGHHTSGWIKNPDYERCFHLSLSFRDMATFEPRPHHRSVALDWCRAFFGQHVRWTWTESPKSKAGRYLDVWHTRLFCDAGWQPIKPRGEVYDRTWTPEDWKTWGEVNPGKTGLVPVGMDPG